MRETRRALKRRVRDLEGIVQRQSHEIRSLVQLLQTMRPVRRPRMSSTRSVWIAGRNHFKCTGDQNLCPCWLLRDGSFDSTGWEVDHESRWSDTFNDTDWNLSAKCYYCHARKTRHERMMDEA